MIAIEKNEDLQKSVELSRGLTVKLFLTTDLTILPLSNSDDSELQRVLAGIPH